MTGAARGDGKEERDLDSGASFHMSHTQAGMTAYQRAPAGTTVEVADKTILPVDGFGTVEVDLDQMGTTTKPVKIVSVAYVPGLGGTCCPPVKQWSNGVNRSFTFKRRLFWGSRGTSCLFSTSGPARGYFPQQVLDGPRAKGQRWGWQQKRLRRWPGEGLRRCETEPEARGGDGGGAESAWYGGGTPRACAPEPGDNAKNGPGNEIATTSQWGSYEGCLQVKTKRQAVQWIDGLDKTGRIGADD